MKRIAIFSLVFLMTLAGAAFSVMAQTETDTGISVTTDIALMRRDLRGEKKKIIAMTVPFTDVEAQKFWPVYDQYAAEMQKPNDEFYTLVKDYVQNQKAMTDDQCTAMIKRWAELQGEQVKVRQKYVPLFEKVIPGKKAALFLQVDRRLYALMDLQSSAALPLVYQ